MWTLINYQIFENGVYKVIPNQSQQALMVLYYNSSIYEEGSNCSVAEWKGTRWVASILPKGAPNPVASLCPTSVIPTVNVLYDSNGNSYTLQNGVVYENGATAGNSSGVIMLVITNDVVYQQNNLCGVWSYNPSNQTWTQTSMPSSLAYQIPLSVDVQCPAIGGVWTAQNYVYPAGTKYNGTMLSSTSGEFYYILDNNAGCVNFYAGNLSVVQSTQPTDSNSTNELVQGNGSISGCGINVGAQNLGASPDVFNADNMFQSMTMYDNQGVFTANEPLYWTQLGIYDTSGAVFYGISKITNLVGTYAVPNSTDTITIEPDGSFTRQYALFNCVVVGNITLDNQPYPNATIGSYNIYSFTATFTCADNIVAMDAGPGATETEQGLMALDGSQLIVGGSITDIGNEFFTATLQ